MAETVPGRTDLTVEPLTEEEMQRAIETLTAIDALREQMLAARGGEPFPSSVDIIRDMREERSRQLDEP